MRRIMKGFYKLLTLKCAHIQAEKPGKPSYPYCNCRIQLETYTPKQYNIMYKNT